MNDKISMRTKEKNVELLFTSENITVISISRDTGISRNTLTKIKKAQNKKKIISNMKYENVLKLSNYYNKKQIEYININYNNSFNNFKNELVNMFDKLINREKLIQHKERTNQSLFIERLQYIKDYVINDNDILLNLFNQRLQEKK